LLQDKQEEKYRHTALEKTGITPLLQRVDKGVGKDTWNTGTQSGPSLLCDNQMESKTK